MVAALLYLFVYYYFRLNEYCENANLINNGQIGFKKGCRTSDHILTLKGIINKYVYDNKQKVYTCFVDFKKAFDSIWQKALLYKLELNNINGKFLNLLKNIYKQTKCTVKINNKLTNFFKYEKGVRQGDPLSPTLFNIYINDLFEEIDKANCDSVTLNNLHQISSLMFSDDLIIISTSKIGLQNSLNALENYTKKWKLEINTKKTKCITFSKGNQKEKHQFKIYNKIIDNVNEYKYLGIVINKKGSFTTALDDLSCKAKRAIYAMNSKINIRFLSVKTLLKLFDSLICPILLYGSEVWEPFLNHDKDKWDTNPIEKIHTQFMKRILGLNRSTSTTLIRGDLGRFSLQSMIISRNLKYLKQIKKKKDETLVKQAFLYENSQSLNRVSFESTIIKFKNNLNNLLNEEIDVYNLSTKNLKNKIKLINCEDWKQKLSNSSKADTYKIFKNSPKYEKYFDHIKNIKHLKAFIKFRLSDHKLLIEEGRRKRPIIPRNQRLCESCHKLEDEIHFLIDCDRYKYDRIDMFKKITSEFPNFKDIKDSNSKFTFLMSQEDKNITILIASCVYNWFLIREGI